MDRKMPTRHVLSIMIGGCVMMNPFSGDATSAKSWLRVHVARRFLSLPILQSYGSQHSSWLVSSEY